MRTGVAVAAGVLLACGAVVLGADAVETSLAGLHGTAQAGLGAAPAAGRPVLDPSVVRYAARHGWFWPAVSLAAEGVALAATTGLWRAGRAALLRRRARPDVPAVAALRAEALRLPGVRDVKVRLTGTRHAPRLVVTVACADGTPLGGLLAALGDGPIARCRDAELPDLVAVVRFRLGPARFRRGAAGR
ncbi:hypothetical protein BTM25_37720 [Actinomadura rubteroloni]|uniref:Alkaline shock response membrane anchor protein AmaP n=1 Tax=Actinomadura rubteroloni TaxID=1926885 RepID=A0A2P4UJC1_9ACTN|nr:hypothetical protein [Actinomadura rubteroloni]POM25130.1 hypothetical protein BTM25_37720 [Actinomadura rubteroloni]